MSQAPPTAPESPSPETELPIVDSGEGAIHPDCQNEICRTHLLQCMAYVITKAKERGAPTTAKDLNQPGEFFVATKAGSVTTLEEQITFMIPKEKLIKVVEFSEGKPEGPENEQQDRVKIDILSGGIQVWVSAEELFKTLN